MTMNRFELLSSDAFRNSAVSERVFLPSRYWVDWLIRLIAGRR